MTQRELNFALLARHGLLERRPLARTELEALVGTLTGSQRREVDAEGARLAEFSG